MRQPAAQKENLSGELQGTECILSAVHTGFYRIGKELRRTRDPCGKEEDIQAALDEARTYTDAPTIIEFMISTDEIVLPMVKSGNPMSEMILK